MDPGPIYEQHLFAGIKGGNAHEASKAGDVSYPRTRTLYEQQSSVRVVLCTSHHTPEWDRVIGKGRMAGLQTTDAGLTHMQKSAGSWK